jgi:hypothetical protein
MPFQIFNPLGDFFFGMEESLELSKLFIPLYISLREE